ncbi:PLASMODESMATA CALLOSE-BINDING PROTEIN 5-like [Silene latifolia]|uniref:PLASMODESMATA CALLOSE-BINDING PROTEIN 5-like n=1 Tax=Silene latifolia TaxID=37657 RepID=UPI003D77CA49
MLNPLMFFLLIAATWHPWIGHTEAAVVHQQLWCVAKNNAEDSALQQALDWACGPGAANCGPIQQGGPCYDPNDIISMASYAFNDYCTKHGMTQETCNFSNTADLIDLDPSHDKCKYPSSAFSVGNSSTPSTSGVIPGSEDLSGSSRFAKVEIWTLVLVVLTAFL